MHQLIYSSRAADVFLGADLERLLQKARAKNEKLDVTGMLVYSVNKFLQVLEGEEHVVEALYRRIAADPRHTHSQVLSRSHIAGRDFGEWSMGFANANPQTIQRVPGFSEIFEADFHSTKFLETPTLARTLLLSFTSAEFRNALAR